VRLNKDEALRRLTEARVAHLATAGTDGQPHIVPVTFSVHNGLVTIAVDHKPKSTVDLKRLANIRANNKVSLLADEYTEDWTRLWWVRADGTATTIDHVHPTLIEKYQQYQENPPVGPAIEIRIDKVIGWSYS
jgi:PPOX class probable F420-dependent enzyme